MSHTEVSCNKKLHLGKIFPFIEDVKVYNFKKFRIDIIAGLTVAIVGTPQAIAYAIIAGVDPRYGLYACIVPVIVAALMGSSRFLVAGPTNTVSMVIFSTVATLSVGGIMVSDFSDAQKMGLIFLMSVLAGAMQFAMGVFKMGNLLNFISHSVIVGFTAGAGILIAFNQIKNLLGLHIHTSSHFIESTIETFKHVGEFDWRALFIGLFTISFVVVSKKISQKIPGSLLAIIISSFFVFIFGWDQAGLSTVGEIPRTLPPLSMPTLDWSVFRAVLMPSFAIAILGVVEAYSIAKSFSSKTGDKIDGNQEFIGQGLANISSGFFSGIAGTGSFTRSAVNFNSNAATRFAAMFSAFMVLAIVLVFASGAQYIPIASLAGILMVIAYSMIDKQSFMLSFKATGSDKVVLMITMFATLFLHLDQAVYTGVVLSIILFVRKVSHPQVFRVTPRKKGEKLVAVDDNKNTCPQIAIYQVEGSLFFGAISEIEEKLSTYLKDGYKTVIIRLEHVHVIDATGIHALETLLREADQKDVEILFTNVKPSVYEVVERSGMLEQVGEENFFEHTSDAIRVSVGKINKMGKCKKCSIQCFKECDIE